MAHADTDNMPTVGKLSSIMEAKAKIAMPEVVSVFISKYETELYERKTALATEISQLRKDQEILAAQILQKAKFDEYVGIKVAKLNLVSELRGDIALSDDGLEYVAEIALVDDNNTRGYNQTFGKKTVTKPVDKKSVGQRTSLAEKVAETEAELSRIIAKISDMSRKERQVKARISELRLAEQGLTDFLNDGEMQKLIAID